MSDKLDVVGIGNAMVDAIIPSNQSEIEKHEINRDSMNLIDENLKNNLHESYSIREMAGGGSLGNSMFGITSFGGNGSFIGKIKNDEIGVYLQKDMIREGLKFPLGFTSPDISTGCCTIFVEEDGTRTMCTFLGAGTLIGPEDIKEDDIKNHKIAYSRPSSKLSVCAIALISSSLAKRISTFSVINSLKESLCLSTQKRSDKVNAIF